MEIVDAVNQNRLAVFIGAGVSRTMGYPDWPLLAKETVKACRSYVQSNTSDDTIPPDFWDKCLCLAEEDPKKALTIIHQLLEERGHGDVFFERAAGCLTDSSRETPNENIYDEIYGLRGFFVTTNMDPEFDGYFRDKNRFIVPENPLEVDRTELYHLHGTVTEPTSMVLTVNKYLECYRNPKVIRFLTWVFENNVVLFLGYGLHEYEVLDFLVLKTGDKTLQSNPKYALVDYNREPDRDPYIDRLYLEALGVTHVPYSSKSEPETSLIRVLKEWRKKINYRSEFLIRTTTDLAQAAASYDESQADRILQTITEANLRDDFLIHLKSSADPASWFVKLHEEGHLEPPTWLTYSYIEKVAAQNERAPSHEITSLTITYIDSAIRRQRNPGTRIERQALDELIIKILFHLPDADVVRERLDFLNFALERDEDGLSIILNLIEEFVPKVIERGWKEILLRFFDTIFEAGYSEAEEAVSRRPVTEYHLIRLCQGSARQAAELCGTDLTRLIGEKIEKCTIKRPRYCHYGWRVRSLADSSEGEKPYSRTDILVRFFIEIGLYLKPEDAIQVVEELRTRDDVIFHRIAVALIDARFAELRHLLVSWPRNPFDDHMLESELSQLFKVHSTELSENELDRIVDWIESSDFNQPPEDDEEERNVAIAYRRKSWFTSLERTGHPRVGEGLRLASVLVPGPVRLEPERITILEKIEPGEEELQPLRGLSSTDLARVLDEKYGATREFHPMTADMEELLQRLVSENPSKYSDDLTPFVRSSSRVHYGLLWGFQEAWEKHRVFSWDDVLTFVETILMTETYAEIEPDFSGSINSWVIGSTASLLLSSVESDDRAIDEHLLARAYALLRSIIFRTPEAPPIDGGDHIHRVLNTSQGRLLQALISLSLHAERIGTESLSIVGVAALRSDLHALLLDEERISADYLTVIGWHYSALYYYNREWVEAHQPLIFPRETPPLWDASMCGLLFRARTVSVDIFNHLKDSGELEHAITCGVTDSQASTQLPLLICRGYNSGLDSIDAPDSLIRTLVLNGTPDHLRQIHWFYDQRIGKEIDEAESERIRAIWRLVMERFEVGEPEIRCEVIAYSSWLSLFDSIDSEIEGWMLTIANNFGEGLHVESGLLDALRHHVDDDPSIVGRILMRALEHSSFGLIFYKEKLRSIVECLFELEQGRSERWAESICNYYAERHDHFLQDIFEKHHPGLSNDSDSLSDR